MKEHSILMSAPMVRAILAGQKTQTRRVVKPRKDRDLGCELAPCELAGEVNGGEYRNAHCQPGDHLWVREAHSIGPGPGVPLQPGESAGVLRWPHVTYAADGAIERRDTRWKGAFGVARPSIHMHRWASRITLEVTGVRVERLLDISVGDAIAEGIPRGGPENPDGIEQREFQALWESINGPGSWKPNPWVWAISFKVV